MATNFSKQDLIERMTESNDIESKAGASRILALVIDTIVEQVAAGNQVDVSGLCSFKPAVQAARTGIAVDGKPYASEAKSVVRIKPAAKFRAAVEGQ